MPITPHFEISQTDDHVMIDILVPHVRVSHESLQVVLSDENKCLHFASPPYLLLLTFQHAFQENAEDACAQYDPLRSYGRIVLKLAKLEAGIYWEDLDMVGALMKPRTNLQSFIDGQNQNHSPQKSTWIKEVLEATSNQEESTEGNAEEKAREIGLETGYGFATMFRGIFTDLARDGLAREMLEIPLDTSDGGLKFLDINKNSDKEISHRQKRLQTEVSKFSAERYLQDFDIQDDYLYQTAMQMRPHWRDTTTDDETQPSNNYFTSQESAQLSSIPYPLLPPWREGDNATPLWLGILDLLFAYCYDHLLTDGDPTVESAWNISILSCSLSWLESFDQGECVADVVAQSIRRSLIYPYLRNVEFGVYCWTQVSQIVTSRRCIIRCLLQVRKILDQSELYYLGNKLYIDPYLAWLQDPRRHNDDNLLTLATDIDAVLQKPNDLKERIGMDLVSIEREVFGDSDDEMTATGSSETDSSDDEEETTSDSDDDNSDDEDDREISGQLETTRQASAKSHSKDLLDDNLALENPASLIVNMTKLSINGEEDGHGGSCQGVARKKLIEEIN
ncbi:Protein SHQ1 homolog [Seminavis robusta]|uniref:Protein SHQ1 homolog n=1 Tax=Seminavis robusta TaxID=568900 RepID=A0A9N8ERG9_9STRA|nr:Protein SHQ1 homolog [Seminavis robusta]|eukprot:Sro1406_g269870.1 Protein SHQ1 homolog (563) ;mRNA; f:7806-9494